MAGALRVEGRRGRPQLRRESCLKIDLTVLGGEDDSEGCRGVESEGCEGVESEGCGEWRARDERSGERGMWGSGERGMRGVESEG